MDVSPLPEARVLPSGENASDQTLSLNKAPGRALGAAPAIRRMNLPVPASHSTIVLPRPADAPVLPSGENATASTHISFPSPPRAISLPLAGSQSWMVAPRPAEASVLPSGEK